MVISSSFPRISFGQNNGEITPRRGKIQKHPTNDTSSRYAQQAGDDAAWMGQLLAEYGDNQASRYGLMRTLHTAAQDRRTPISDDEAQRLADAAINAALGESTLDPSDEGRIKRLMGG